MNRTLISDETNNKISDTAPADYLASTDVFPSGPTPTLMEPHFLIGAAIDVMQSANGTLTNAEVATRYEAFRQAREGAIVAEIRRACGIEHFAKIREDSHQSQTATASVSSDATPAIIVERTASDGIWHVLTRIPIPIGQQKVYRALSVHCCKWHKHVQAPVIMTPSSASSPLGQRIQQILLERNHEPISLIELQNVLRRQGYKIAEDRLRELLNDRQMYTTLAGIATFSAISSMRRQRH